MLQFDFAVEPDEHGVFDGRELAALMIAYAFRLVVPYVNGCPACADALFSRIAETVIEEAHEEGRREGGGLPSGMYATGQPDDREARKEAHIRAAQVRTAALLGVELDHQHTH